VVHGQLLSFIAERHGQPALFGRRCIRPVRRAEQTSWL
jgi:hypothetical protein